MKLKFLFLFLFIANFCVAQNQLQITKTYSLINYTSSYFLHEHQEAKVRFLNSHSEETILKGKVDSIADSFLVIKNQKIFYDSMIKIAFNKYNREELMRRNEKLSMYGGAVIIGLTAIVGVFYAMADKQHSNQVQTINSNEYYNSYYEPLFIGFILSYFSLPFIAGNGLKMAFFNKTPFYVLKKKSKRNYWKLNVIHSFSPK